MAEATHRAVSINVADIRSDTGGTTNIIETQRGHKRVDFEEER